jgi:hypothetical protein
MSRNIQKLIGIELPSPEDLLLQQQSTQQNRQPDQQQTSTEGTPLGFIQFTLMDNGNVGLLCEFGNWSDDLAESYGEMLHCINSGYIKNDIANTLLQYTKHDKTKQPFIKKVLLAWQKYADKPIISPTNALKQSEKQPVLTGNQIDTMPHEEE